MSEVHNVNFEDPIEKAISFALAAHHGQKRSERVGGFEVPFLFHPMEVAKRVWNWGAGTVVRMQGAVLHDVDEDTDYDIIMIRNFFGSQVADLVRELTFHEDPKWDHPVKKAKKLEYMASFATKSLDALVVKLSDRLCNVEDFTLSNPKYAPKYFHKADSLFNALFDRDEELAKVLGRNTSDAMIKDFRRVEQAMTRLSTN